MKILFVGGLFPSTNSDYYFENTKQYYQAAANEFQWNIVRGLEKNIGPVIDIYNSVFISSYPKGFRKIIEKNYNWRHNTHSRNKNIGFVNLPLIKNIDRQMRIRLQTKKWYKENKNENIHVIIYAPHVPFLKISKFFKKNNVDVTLVLPDLPEFTGTRNKKFLVYRILKKIEIRRFYRLLNYVDNFVVITEQLAHKIKAKKYCVIEGIADPKLINPFITFNERLKIVVYTGTLHSRYGIKKVVDAFQYIECKDFRLYICGSGDTEEYIKKASLNDTRIKYLGVLSYEETIKLQREANILINPRPNNNEFTKFSFPSKTIEYLLTGKPTLCYKLDGIPDDYDKHLIYIESYSAKSIADKIIEIAKTDEEILLERGMRTIDFILHNKTNKKQAFKIIELLKEQ